MVVRLKGKYRLCLLDYRTVKEKKDFMMALNLLATMLMEKKKEKGNIIGMIHLITMVNLKMINFKVYNKKRSIILGKGVFIWYDGKRYEGDWLNGLMHGKGELTY